MKTKIAVVIGIIIAGISCFGAGQSQGYRPEKRVLPEPIVMQVKAAELESPSIGFVTATGDNPFSDVRVNVNGSAPYTDDYYQMINHPVSIAAKKNVHCTAGYDRESHPIRCTADT